VKKVPKISIVTPSYNQGKFLEKTILSVLNQNYNNLEYIIIDGGSTDESVKIIKHYGQYLKYWHSKPDAGQASAIREGFKQATGDVLGYLNSDDMLLSGALQAVVDIFSKEQKIQCLAGDCIYIDVKDRYLFTSYSREQTYKNMLFNTMLNCQPATFWRREIYDKVGGIDVNFQYCMDYDLFLRMLKKTGKMFSIPVILAAFRVHEESKGNRLKEISTKEWNLIRSRHKVIPTKLSKILWRIRMKSWRTQRKIKNFLFNNRDRKIWEKTLLQLSSNNIFK